VLMLSPTINTNSTAVLSMSFLPMVIFVGAPSLDFGFHAAGGDA
jgi:hypothetical protein